MICRIKLKKLENFCHMYLFQFEATIQCYMNANEHIVMYVIYNI